MEIGYIDNSLTPLVEGKGKKKKQKTTPEGLDSGLQRLKFKKTLRPTLSWGEKRGLISYFALVCCPYFGVVGKRVATSKGMDTCFQK